MGMKNKSGQTIQGCELLDRIGAGGFGAVYTAIQSTVGREVAVKVHSTHRKGQRNPQCLIVPIGELMEMAQSCLSRDLTDKECQRYLHQDSCKLEE